MESLVEELCSPACAGRAMGSAGGARARTIVAQALRNAGLDPAEQRIGRSRGANLVATLPGSVDRWVLVAAHYDHLGEAGRGKAYYPGADDNAAAVAILVEVARGLARKRADGRGVILAAFDGEEPPHFLTGEMGSAWYAKHASEVGPPVERIDMMVCMDLVGHGLGPDGLPDPVRSTLFALGAERSQGTSTRVDAIARSERGLVVRRADAEIVPPLSDYDAFWKRRIPFLFLTAGRSARYHTPADTPEHLDWAKMRATAAWLERFVRDTCADQPEAPIRFEPHARDDASTLRSLAAILEPLTAVSPLARVTAAAASELLASCDTEGRLPPALGDRPAELVLGLENALA